MSKVNELIEWEYLGSRHSLYIKNFIDDEFKKGVTMIYEDISAGKVTEIVIPTQKMPAFLRAVTSGEPLNNSL